MVKRGLVGVFTEHLPSTAGKNLRADEATQTATLSTQPCGAQTRPSERRAQTGDTRCRLRTSLFWNT